MIDRLPARGAGDQRPRSCRPGRLLPDLPWVVGVIVALTTGLGLLGAGCARRGPPLTAQPPASHSGSEPPPSTGKPTPPVDLAVGAAPPGQLSRPTTLALTASPRIDAASLSLAVSVAGVVQLISPATALTKWDSVPTGATRELNVAFACPRAGVGSITVVARATDAAGLGHERTAIVDVLAWDDEVLAGTNGQQQLQLQHLDHQLARGTIERSAYDQRRAAVLGGGAAEGSVASP